MNNSIGKCALISKTHSPIYRAAFPVKACFTTIDAVFHVPLTMTFVLCLCFGGFIQNPIWNESEMWNLLFLKDFPDVLLS